jgi:response regulator of citrate/malate metabolism
VLATLRGNDPSSLPKGVSPDSLDAVVSVLRPSQEALSATEVAAVLGASRVTARRYLEHLADVGLVVRRSRYGGSGRPEVEYRWLGGG